MLRSSDSGQKLLYMDLTKDDTKCDPRTGPNLAADMNMAEFVRIPTCQGAAAMQCNVHIRLALT